VPGFQAQDYFCYKLKCPKGTEIPLEVVDQFRHFAITVKKKPNHLCVPARKVLLEPTPTPPPPTRTPTPTATETPVPTPTRTPIEPPCDFDSAIGQCNGACPAADEKCLFVGSPAICDCVPAQEMCMGQTGGTCNGLCPNVNDRCLFVAGTTDCDCFPSQQTCKRDPVSGQCGGTCPQDPTGVHLKCLAIGTMGCDCVPPEQMCMPQEPIPPGTCGGLCPDPSDVCEGQDGGPCDCFPSQAPCGLYDDAAGQPQCFGQCPPGELCVFDGATPCRCSPDFCGVQGAAGQCGGPCPNPNHVCHATTDPNAPCACSP
jgi:hypothetical protein